MTDIDPRLSRLYREAATEEPPAAVDAAILAAARKHAAPPRRPQRSPWLRWMAPASAIATLALGVSIALLVERERPEIIDDSAVRQIAPPPSPPSAGVAESAKTRAADSAAAGGAEKKEAPAVTAPEPATPAPQLKPAPSAAEAFSGGNRAKAAAPRMAEPNAAMESSVARDAALGAAGAGAPAAPAAAGQMAPLRQQAIQRAPEAWLEEISRLKREGRDREAAEQLAQFRKAYPAHPLPQNLLSK